MTIWAIVPVKPLRDGKSRLAHILSADQRASLTTGMLRRTLQALKKTADIDRTLVISRDPAVLKMARQHHASTFEEGEKLGLNLALARATQIAMAQGASAVLVLPADLPLIRTGDVEAMINHSLSGTPRQENSNGRHPRLPVERIMAICPDRQEDGTNALLLNPPLGFRFQYGPDSFSLHLEEAARLGMESLIVHSPGLKFDLDTEEDWYTYQALLGEAVPSL